VYVRNASSKPNTRSRCIADQQYRCLAGSRRSWRQHIVDSEISVGVQGHSVGAVGRGRGGRTAEQCCDNACPRVGSDAIASRKKQPAPLESYVPRALISASRSAIRQGPAGLTPLTTLRVVTPFEIPVTGITPIPPLNVSSVESWAAARSAQLSTRANNRPRSTAGVTLALRDFLTQCFFKFFSFFECMRRLCTGQQLCTILLPFPCDSCLFIEDEPILSCQLSRNVEVKFL
jgi:hypothetical protein